MVEVKMHEDNRLLLLPFLLHSIVFLDMYIVCVLFRAEEQPQFCTLTPLRTQHWCWHRYASAMGIVNVYCKC